jgi:hypothetical protein
MKRTSHGQNQISVVYKNKFNPYKNDYRQYSSIREKTKLEEGIIHCQRNVMYARSRPYLERVFVLVVVFMFTDL